jgi:hypothetical protein
MTDASARGGMFTPATIVCAAREQATAALPDETIILGMRDGVYYGVADVAARIWRLLATPIALGAIHEVIVAEFAVSADDAWRDLVAFLESLRAAGLLEIRPDA